MIPYYAWANRGAGADGGLAAASGRPGGAPPRAAPPPPSARPSASHSGQGRPPDALNDGDRARELERPRRPALHLVGPQGHQPNGSSTTSQADARSRRPPSTGSTTPGAEVPPRVARVVQGGRWLAGGFQTLSIHGREGPLQRRSLRRDRDDGTAFWRRSLPTAFPPASWNGR